MAFGTTLILLSAPKAASYYPYIGMTKHESCWIIPEVMRDRQLECRTLRRQTLFCLEAGFVGCRVAVSVTRRADS